MLLKSKVLPERSVQLEGPEEQPSTTMNQKTTAHLLLIRMTKMTGMTGMTGMVQQRCVWCEPVARASL
jgi:hypothetical protein